MAMASDPLSGKRVFIVVAHEFEDIELLCAPQPSLSLIHVGELRGHRVGTPSCA